MVLPMRNPEATRLTSYHPSLETARTDSNFDVQIPAWKATLNENNKLWSQKVVAKANDEAYVKDENFSMGSHCTNSGDLVAK